MSDYEINGIKIQRLPTVGSPLSIKGTRWRPTNVDIKVNSANAKKLKEIKKVLSKEDKDDSATK